MTLSLVEEQDELSEEEFLAGLSTHVEGFNTHLEALRADWEYALLFWAEKPGPERKAFEKEVGSQFGRIKLGQDERLTFRWPDGFPERSRATMLGVALDTVQRDKKALTDIGQSAPTPAPRGTRTAVEEAPELLPDDDDEIEDLVEDDDIENAGEPEPVKGKAFETGCGMGTTSNGKHYLFIRSPDIFTFRVYNPSAWSEEEYTLTQAKDKAQEAIEFLQTLLIRLDKKIANPSYDGSSEFKWHPDYDKEIH